MMDAFYPPPSAFDSSFNNGRTGREWRLMAARTAAEMMMNSLKQSGFWVQSRFIINFEHREQSETTFCVFCSLELP